ncbi:hypothetical protein HK099_003905 [Clydaea vesicula]|uniref:Uncharacterized protein n=1 Tax=Clydaea vesicula TaxID=447962 RepID=A0AAD5U1E6_9FUNG|nr:hypothetical protein HK099_003905 [Clydaea vesicula]
MSETQPKPPSSSTNSIVQPLGARLSTLVLKTHGTPQLSRAYLQRIMMDENTQYLLLAVVWFTSPPVFGTIT